MAIPWIPLAGAALGAIAGSQAQGPQLSREGQLEREARLAQTGGFQKLEDIQTGQLGAQANLASENLARLLQQYQTSGGMPTQAQMGAAQQYAQQVTAPQQVALDQAMRQSQQEFARQAGLSGRRTTDFALQTRLGAQRTQGMERLGAAQSQIGAEYANQLSQNTLGYAQQLQGLRQGLMSQAMENRMAIMRLGQGIQTGQQQFRMGTAKQGGGMLGGLTGALSGASAGLGLMQNFSSMFGGTGAGAGSGQQVQNNVIRAGESIAIPSTSITAQRAPSQGMTRSLASTSAPSTYAAPAPQMSTNIMGIDTPFTMQGAIENSVYQVNPALQPPFWMR